MSEYDASSTSSATPEQIWPLLTDARTWPAWTPIDELVVERSTGLGPDHRATEVGSVRVFRTGDAVSGERITEVVEHRRLGYVDEFNDALSDYRAVVDLTPAPAGTQIRWRGSYTPAAGLEEVLPGYLAQFMQQMADGLAAHAARSVGDSH